MGDRGNIVLQFEDGEICLYTHWDRSELINDLARALDRGRSRWYDPQYLARIIFCEMIKDDVLGTTGYGLSPSIGDGDSTVVVEMESQNVHYNGRNYDYEAVIDKWK